MNDKDEMKWVRQVRRVQPPDLWDEIQSRPITKSRSARARMLGPVRTAALFAVAAAVVGGALFALSGLREVGETSQVPLAEPSDQSQVATDWFRLTPPTGWTAVAPSGGTPLGNGVVAAQLTNFDVDGVVCTGGDYGIPSDGVLLRLTIGTELGWEGNLVTPGLDPKVASRAGPSPSTFVDNCGATEKLFGMFYGPDGQVMTAHALIGAQAAASDREAVDSILASLQPTGHEPVRVPVVETMFTEGTDATIGRWAMTLLSGEGAESFFFRTEDQGAGIFVDASNQSVQNFWVGYGDGELIVSGVGPQDVAEVRLKVEGQPDVTGTVVPVPQDQLPGLVAFWVGPFRGELTAEGTALTPSAELITLDENGTVLERVQLPVN